MKAVVIDDEQAARGMLCEMLARRNDVVLLGEAANGIEAIELINARRPDLIFLDVQMPVLSGFDILPYLEISPLIVFCTAHEDYAVQAFDAAAVDYLLKPVCEARLDRCFEKIREQGRVIASLDKLAVPETLQKIVCRNQRTRHVVWLDEVLYCRKEGRYTAVMSAKGGPFLTDLTLDYLDAQLPADRFCRINRGVIISRQLVRSFSTNASGTGELIARNGETFTISRGRLGAFNSWL